MNDCESKCYAATLGNARVVGAGRIWKFTTKHFVVRVEMIPKRSDHSLHRMPFACASLFFLKHGPAKPVPEQQCLALFAIGCLAKPKLTIPETISLYDLNGIEHSQEPTRPPLNPPVLARLAGKGLRWDWLSCGRYCKP
jgi:hypothetical protein